MKKKPSAKSAAAGAKAAGKKTIGKAAESATMPQGSASGKNKATMPRDSVAGKKGSSKESAAMPQGSALGSAVPSESGVPCPTGGLSQSASPLCGEEVTAILAEDRRRTALYTSQGFDPVTGLGSVGARIPLSIPDFPLPQQWIPRDMDAESLVQSLRKAKTLAACAAAEFPSQPLHTAADAIIDAFVRLRCRHDFPFWAATFAYVKNKEPGAPDCLFRLTYPQRRFVEQLEALRLASRPIRIILLKARQWGGSTTSQLYMAWLQLIHRKGLNSLIIAHQNAGSDKIKAMFRRLIDSYPESMLVDIGQPAPRAQSKLTGEGTSRLSQRIPSRNAVISIGSAESPDSCRGGDYALVHLSEVGLWKTTLGKKPSDIVRSACSGVLYRPYTMIVYESTANGVGNFFHREYTAAKDPSKPSQFIPMFVSWFEIDLYTLPFAPDDPAPHMRSPQAFARWLIDNRNRTDIANDRQEPGSYLWWLWQKGASLEGIHWYITERAKYDDHGQMASEYPSDDDEAFVNSANRVFDKTIVDRLRPSCRPPREIGDMTADAPSGIRALQGVRFTPDPAGQLAIWEHPDLPQDSDPDFVTDRYLVVVDIGGRHIKADWSVIAVFDRIAQTDGRGPAIVAQWYGHTDMDILAWKAAQIAAYYDNALLVIESNTIETHDAERHIEGGDQSLYLFNQIRDAYPNLYARPQSEDDIRAGLPLKYGFHTNAATKPLVISTLVKCVREHAWTERDSRCLDELIDYERKPNGAYGAISGKHDDLLMTRAIGLYIAYSGMPLPRIVSRASLALPSSSSLPISEATI